MQMREVRQVTRALEETLQLQMEPKDNQYLMQFKKNSDLDRTSTVLSSQKDNRVDR